MREILFRGRDIKGNWHYGGLEVFSDDLCKITNHKLLEYGKIVERESIGQYTGLCDKNGTKIFEGDIVKTHYANANAAEFIEMVVFEGGAFRAKKKYPNNSSHSALLYNGTPHLKIDKSVYMDNIEVIGNIHDNPELLKEGE